mgnify:CR=1 FL=1|jgi:hypothetical protein|tara:strand:- start:5906 stop:6277 length:372 start_codon:yes stop_codon:yes gene_type:complete
MSIKTLKNLLEQYEDKFRLDKDLEIASLRLIMEPGSHVPDTLTRIRVLPTVSVVGQKDKVRRPTKGGRVILDVYIKFLPPSKSIRKNLLSLGRMIKSFPGVTTIKVLSYNSRDISYQGKPMII